MATPSTISSFWAGFRTGAPFLLVIIPFSLLFGVVATEAGFSLVETMGFSVVVLAGAAQFVAVQLMTEHAPTLIVIATAVAVNLRMAMYSASLTPHIGKAPIWQRALVAYLMTDQSYATSHAHYEQHRDLPVPQKVAFYFGTATPIVPMWFAFSYTGALVGKSIPPEYALDFAIPITFLALIAPALRTLAHVAAAAVSVVLGLALAFMPYNSGLFLAAIGAMITGAQVELWQERRAHQGLGPQGGAQ